MPAEAMAAHLIVDTTIVGTRSAASSRSHGSAEPRGDTQEQFDRQFRIGDVSVVVPTRNEAGNVSMLLDRLCGPAPGLVGEVVFVDAAKVLFPRALAGVSDPMSGFFLARRDAVAIDRLRPRGFKILLEIMVRERRLRAVEAPYQFDERAWGATKASLRQGLLFVVHLLTLRAL